MMKKIKRSWLIALVAGMGILMVAYTLVRTFTPLRLGEKAERYFFDILIFTALGVFVYNRKMAADEKREREKEKDQVQEDQVTEDPVKDNLSPPGT
jgi:hypothetical protein